MIEVKLQSDSSLLVWPLYCLPKLSMKLHDKLKSPFKNKFNHLVFYDLNIIFVLTSAPE